jgi:hypothetical protein
VRSLLLKLFFGVCDLFGTNLKPSSFLFALRWHTKQDVAFYLQDIETFDLEDFKYNSVNITAFRLVDVEDSRVAEKLAQMEKFQPIGHDILNRSGIIQVRNYLTHIWNEISSQGSHIGLSPILSKT